MSDESKCSNCGLPIDDPTAPYCVGCGTVLNAAAATAVPLPEPRSWPFTAAAVLVLVGVLGALWWWLPVGSPTPRIEPAGWSPKPSFRIQWQKHGWSLGTRAIWYKLGTAPDGPTDGTRLIQQPFVIQATAEGGQSLFIWAEDALGRKDHRHAARLLLRYDGTAPSADVRITSSDRAVSKLDVELNIEATDTGGSGATEIAVSNDNGHWTTFPLPRNRANWHLLEGGGWGPRTIYWRVSDGTGNRSERRSLTIAYAPPPDSTRRQALDLVASGAFQEAWRQLLHGRELYPNAEELMRPLPTAKVLLNGGARFVSMATVDVAVHDWQVDTDEISGIELSNDGTQWSTYHLPAEPTTWQLDDAGRFGERSVHWRLKNRSGLTSEEQVISLTYAESTDSIRTRAFDAVSRSDIEKGKAILQQALASYPGARELEAPLRELEKGVLILLQYHTPQEVGPLRPLDECDGLTLARNDNYRLAIVPSRDCFVYVFRADAWQSFSLFPNTVYTPESNPLAAGRVHWLPEHPNTPGPWWMRLDASIGQERFCVVAVSKPLRDLETFRRQLLSSREKIGNVLRHNLQSVLETGGTPGTSCFAEAVVQVLAFKQGN
jgi:hypothetical protein